MLGPQIFSVIKIFCPKVLFMLLQGENKACWFSRDCTLTKLYFPFLEVKIYVTFENITFLGLNLLLKFPFPLKIISIPLFYIESLFGSPSTHTVSFLIIGFHFHPGHQLLKHKIGRRNISSL